MVLLTIDVFVLLIARMRVIAVVKSNNFFYCFKGIVRVRRR